MTAALVVDALNMAAWVRRGVDIHGVICHNDAGSQYTSVAYTDRLDGWRRPVDRDRRRLPVNRPTRSGAGSLKY